MIIAAYWQLVKRVHARENEFSATQFLFREFSTICQTAFKTAYLQSRAGIFKAQHQNSNMRRENSGLKLFLSTVREAIIRKKFYFTKKNLQTGGGSSRFHIFFLRLKRARTGTHQKKSFIKPLRGGGGQRFTKLFRKIEFFSNDGFPEGGLQKKCPF